jgi:hypothetical protein
MARRSCHLAAAVLVAIGGGCVPLPIPVPAHQIGLRENIGARAPDWMQAGRTTRADLILGLGEPDFSDAAEQRLGWVAGRSMGGVPFIWGIAGAEGAGAAGVAGAFLIERVDYVRLIVWFDRDGNVDRYRQESRGCFEAPGLTDDLPSGSLGTHPCVGLSWIQGTDPDAAHP